MAALVARSDNGAGTGPRTYRRGVILRPTGSARVK